MVDANQSTIDDADTCVRPRLPAIRVRIAHADRRLHARQFQFGFLIFVDRLGLGDDAAAREQRRARDRRRASHQPRLNRRAATNATASSTATYAATPAHAPRCQNAPPTEPSTLDPT